ncbi:hypothetical protein KTT_13160 [Tengunoibacter tsumagoiensis]|uniref:Uncharacterized protein n=1 Tax=Tengunoibacter tsumagoiensis TaxID=2014871 RepID=A0A401ZX90_9CHLR|nr:hypothetical protein KTT_13160 [Tengunoibacter tsumagoiensis]
MERLQMAVAVGDTDLDSLALLDKVPAVQQMAAGLDNYPVAAASSAAALVGHPVAAASSVAALVLPPTPVVPPLVPVD